MAHSRVHRRPFHSTRSSGGLQVGFSSSLFRFFISLFFFFLSNRRPPQRRRATERLCFPLWSRHSPNCFTEFPSFPSSFSPPIVRWWVANWNQSPVHKAHCSSVQFLSPFFTCCYTQHSKNSLTEKESFLVILFGVSILHCFFLYHVIPSFVSSFSCLLSLQCKAFCPQLSHHWTVVMSSHTQSETEADTPRDSETHGRQLELTPLRCHWVYCIFSHCSISCCRKKEKEKRRGQWQTLQHLIHLSIASQSCPSLSMNSQNSYRTHWKPYTIRAKRQFKVIKQSGESIEWTIERKWSFSVFFSMLRNVQ